MIDLICEGCGGEIVTRLDPAAAAVSLRCVACGAGDPEAIAPDDEARRALSDVSRGARALRRTVRALRPFVLLWLPPDGGAHRDVALMVRERLAEDDAYVTGVFEGYPDSVEEPSALLAGLADLCILSAPGTAALAGARGIVGEVVPDGRCLVLATGGEAGHGRVVSLGSEEPGALFDAVSRALVHVRRMGFLCAVDAEVAPDDLLLPGERESAHAACASDEAAMYLLYLAARFEGWSRNRLLDRAGGGARLARRLDALLTAELLVVLQGGVGLTLAGRRLLRLTEAAGIAAPPEEESALGRLFREAREGDQEALGRLLKTGGDEALRIARQRIGPLLRRKVDSVDISQSVVGDLLATLDAFEFRGEAAWKGYLRSLVENKIRAKADYYGAAKRDLRRERSLDRRPGEAAGRPEPAASLPTPSDVLLRQEEFERLEAAIARLPDGERDVLVKRFFEGLSHREIADLQGRPSVNAVHKLYGRALARLTGLMKRA